MDLENLTRTLELAYWWKENKQLSPYIFKYVWEPLLLQTLLCLCNICFSLFLGNKVQSYSAQQNVPLRWHVPVFSWIEGNHQQDVSRSYQVGFAGKLLRKRGRPWYVLFYFLHAPSCFLECSYEGWNSRSHFGPWNNPQDGNHMLKMTGQKDWRNLSVWWLLNKPRTA